MAIPAALFDNEWFWVAVALAVLLLAACALVAIRRQRARRRLLAQFSQSFGSSTSVSQTTYVDRGDKAEPEAEVFSAPPTETASSEDSYWEQRASAAERRAERATAVVRAGLTPHLARLLKDQLVWTLMAQRTQMVSTQSAGAGMLEELEQRLARIQTEFESRAESYEQRIAELEAELETRSEVNRELLGATIGMAKRAMQDVAERRPDFPFAAKYLIQKRAEVGTAVRTTGKDREEKFPFGDILARRGPKGRR
jgi:hypothetical protein